MRKIYKGLAGALLLSFGSVPAMAGVDTFSIPATQDEFDTWVQVVPEGAERWTLVTDNGPDPYASVVTCITDYNSSDPGQMLLAPKEYNLKAGEKIKFKAFLSASDDNGYYRYMFVGRSTDDEPVLVKGFRSSVYGGAESLEWKEKTEAFDFVIPSDGTYRFGVAVMGQKDFITVPPAFLFKSIEVEREDDGPAYAKWASLQPAKADPDGEQIVTLSFTWPSKTKSGAVLDNVGGMIYRSPDSQFQGAKFVADVTGVPGEDDVYVDCAQNNPETCITEDNEYSYWIRTYTVVDGEKILSDATPPMARTAWVGGDTDVLPLDPAKASLEPIEGGFNVNFAKEFIGANGGQVKASECAVKITRQRGAEAPVTLVADYKGDSPYVDTTVDQPGSYLYRLFVVYKGKETSECAVGPAYNGTAVNVPYSESLDAPESMSLFSIVSDGSYRWGYNETEACAEFLSSEMITCKSNMMTPPVRLVSNTKYQVAFKSWVDEAEGNAVARKITVTYGTAPEFDGLKNVRSVMVTNVASDKGSFTCTIEPEEDGEYFIGFEAEYVGNSKVYVDDIEIVESSRIPGKVTDFNVTPDASGANKATVTFNLPALTSGGSPLEEISELLVYRYNEEAGSAAVTVPDVTLIPGAKVSFVDEVAAPDYYSYMVYTKKGSDLSPLFQSEDFWIGADTPGAASNAVAALEGKVLTLSWDAAGSAHGGVVPGLKYEVYRRAACQEDPEKVAETTDLSYVDSDTDALEYNVYTYSVAARAADVATEAAAAEPVLLGDHASLPLNPDFLNEEAFLAWELSGAVHDGINLDFVDFGDGEEMFVLTPPFMAPEVSETPALEIALGVSNDVTGEMVSGEIKVYAVALETAKVARDAEPVETLLATVEVNGDTPALVEKDNLLLPAKGKYRVKIASDTEGLALTAIKVAADSSTVGVAGISSESGDAVYFTVDGLRVEKPSVPGIYIKVEGSKSTRIIVR